MLRQFAFLTSLLLAFAVAGCKPKASPSTQSTNGPASPSAEFFSLMNAGRNFLNQGDATNALALYKKAEAIFPNDPDLRLNLANCHLLSGAATEAIREADEALKMDLNSAAAWFVKGSACLRLSKPEEAAKALENVQRIDPGDTAALFQLGRARMELKQWDAAIAAFKEGIALDPGHLHTMAHYLLAQALLRAGRQDEAQKEMEQHLAGLEPGGAASGMATFEKSKYTQARVPFKLEQPDKEGVKVTFVDATPQTLGEAAQDLSGPVALLDLNHNGWNSLFVLEKGERFRLLRNENGVFRRDEKAFPAILNAHYSAMLVGDLQNDRFEDVVVLGDKGSHVFQFRTNGLITDVTRQSRLENVKARGGTLVDLDFTGKLDLVAVVAAEQEQEAAAVRVYRQFGAMLFSEVTSTSGIPASVQNARQVAMEDWNRDGNLDLIVSRNAGTPLLLEKQRGGLLVPRELTNWVAGAVFCTGDFDNDLRPDLAVVGEGKITICFNGGQRTEIPLPGPAGNFRQLVAFDYDNDGWLDLWAVGDTVRVWRNAGLAGFQDRTTQLGLDKLIDSAVSEIQFADFDQDCDSDVIVALANGGLRYLRNEGANANSQVKVQLFGNRSNASGLGCKVEIETGGLRVLRTVQRLPVEIGVGKYHQLDSFLVHWLNWPQGTAELPINCKQPILALELTLQEGSCPYLYAWDGNRFRFVTDVLGASPLGLPVAPGVYTGADPEELVWIGDEQMFPARDGKYQVRITEELREVLYLDEAKLVVVDREPGTEVHSTDKLLPSGPFPKGSLMTLHREHMLQKAETLDGQDVTEALKAIDGRRVSPPKVRAPQLRGLAEPHGLILDFGTLDASQPLVLVMNGWIRFGGGMANIAASHDPSLPFPFPSLEMEVAPGVWRPVNVTVGTPAGKTKTILVDLEGKLAKGARRLRLTEAFELHWDRIALMEKNAEAQTKVTYLSPTEAELHFRGFSPLRQLPWDWPLTPDYDKVSPNSCWTIIPGGWCTRYGDVKELVASRDEGLVLINAGDELTLNFASTALPPQPAGSVREFFLHTDGWDKDSDFHVAAGATVDPLPFHGMNDQLYGKEKRPEFPSDTLHRKYNTRWVEGTSLKRAVAQTAFDHAARN